MKQNILITGGHVTPAIATIDVLRASYPDWTFIFVGRKIAVEGETLESEEYRLITHMHIPFFPIIAGRFKRERHIGTLLALLKVPIGFLQALWYVATQQPTLIVSFGGYVALPVVIAGWLFRVRVVTHEQTRKPGLANRIISRLATLTCVSFSDGTQGLSGNLVETGLPMRTSIFHPPKTTSLNLPKEKRPILLVVGGSTGSVSINTVIYDALPKLLEMYTVIHQVGRVSMNTQKERNDHYIPVPYLSQEDYSWALDHATLVVGRSGANTVMEIAATAKIALFIPLPWAAENEQYHNARFLTDVGSCEILEQVNVSADTLVAAIKNINDTYNNRIKKAKAIAHNIPRDGAERLGKVIYGIATS